MNRKYKEVLRLDLVAMNNETTTDSENVSFFNGALYYYVLLQYIDEFIINDNESFRIKELDSLKGKVRNTVDVWYL